MKISIGSKIITGPWGGGNLFAQNLSEYLINKGHSVIYDLSEKNIDLILLTDPRKRSESSSTFNHIEISKYKKYINPNVIVVQRINECDERKNTKNINKFYLNASNVADHVVFVSKWLQNIYLNIGMKEDKTSVILAGANSEIFNDDDLVQYEKNDKVKIVTHHWSSHINKGFKVYKMIDELLVDEYWKDKIEFTYIGNSSSEYPLTNSNVIPPLSGLNLSSKLKENHIYVTASINEPSGNHHIEASQCGLPVMYIESGGIPEYCKDYGISFNEYNFTEKLKYLINNYEIYRSNLKDYAFSSDIMCGEFDLLFNKLILTKEKDIVPHYVGINGHLHLFKNKMLNRFRFMLNFRANLSQFIKSIIRKGEI